MRAEEFEFEVAPGRNRVLYLFGHLLAIHDGMYALLGFGARAYTHLDRLFLTEPDCTGSEYPALAELRAAWTSLHPTLDDKLQTLSPEAWAGPHTAVSQADFKENPRRNRFSVLLSRTNHLAHHMGQVRLAKQRTGKES